MLWIGATPYSKLVEQVALRLYRSLAEIGDDLPDPFQLRVPDHVVSVPAWQTLPFCDGEKFLSQPSFFLSVHAWLWASGVPSVSD
jgi:hypothetical protein